MFVSFVFGMCRKAAAFFHILSLYSISVIQVMTSVICLQEHSLNLSNFAECKPTL